MQSNVSQFIIICDHSVNLPPIPVKTMAANMNSVHPMMTFASDAELLQVLMAENDAIICVKSMMINENGR